MITLEEKRTLVKDNKDSAVAAINAYLDKIYNLTDPFFENNEIIDTSKVNDILSKTNEKVDDSDKFLNFIKSCRNSVDKFEKVRLKILSNDFNLSAEEICYVELAFTYTGVIFNKKIKELQKALSLNEEILQKLSEEIQT